MGKAGVGGRPRAPCSDSTRPLIRQWRHTDDRRSHHTPGHAQRFLATHGPIASHFRPRRHRLTAAAYRETRDQRFATWRAVTGVSVAA